MRSYFSASFISLLFCVAASAQETFLDTFIRKDGIYAQPEFGPREPRTLFAVASSKRKTINAESLLSIEASDRIRRYSTPAFGDQKKEPYSYFRILRDLEAQDSAAYFESMADMPPGYSQLFTGFFHLENNHFAKALNVFDNLVNNSVDSLVKKESVFWLDETKKLWEDEKEYSIILAAYAETEHPRKEKFAQLIHFLSPVHSPAYVFHKYLIQYNYAFRINDYKPARELYDSVLAYTVHPKMKASLTKNRDAIQELLDAKEAFIKTRSNNSYHYDIDFLYDHLEAWGMDTVTDRSFAEEAGFTLQKKYASKTDTIYTRWLKDTTQADSLSKFEVLSFLRTPLQGGRRFVMVKLGFDHEDTYKKYHSFLERFKSKPLSQSLMQYKTRVEGNEYMLSNFFIAALYQLDDPRLKYELCIYLVEDMEGNRYAVDTLF